MLLYKMVKEHVYQTVKLPELYAKHVTYLYIREDRTNAFLQLFTRHIGIQWDFMFICIQTYTKQINIHIKISIYIYKDIMYTHHCTLKHTNIS